MKRCSEQTSLRNVQVSEDLAVAGSSHLQSVGVGLSIAVSGETTLGRVAINDTLLQRGPCVVEGTLLVKRPLTVQAQCNIHSMHVSDQVRGRSTLELNPSEIVVEGKTTLKSELEALKGVTNLRDLRVKQHSELLTLKALDWAMFNGVVEVDGQTTLRGAAQLSSELHVGGTTVLKSNVEVDGSLHVTRSTVVQDLRVSKDLETIGKTDCGDVVLFHNGYM
jgi:cytoskeletal protein CcmA (bactofilin family)